MARVLVIEDNAANLTFAVFLLESASHEVMTATDAEEGLALARARLPDLIRMDEATRRRVDELWPQLGIRL